MAQTVTIHRIARQSLATDWYHTHRSLLMPFSGSTGLVVHLHCLTGSRKALCKSRLGYYTHVLGVPGQCKSVALTLSHKMEFYCCANRVFANPVTIISKLCAFACIHAWLPHVSMPKICR